VVLEDRVIGEGCNEVLAACDPTAHAEVVAIRAAAAELGTFSLAGATLYATCEPCPMCLGAIYWARIERLFFASTRQQAASIGFDDERFYRELALPPEARSVPMERIASPDADALLALWLQRPDRRPY
jgi:tRNA(Arg) A34 adenosine deaminase TadA